MTWCICSRCCLNLILNGMDALNGTRLEDRRVSVSARLDGARRVEIAVSDGGAGVPADLLTQIFFHRFSPPSLGPSRSTRPNRWTWSLPRKPRHEHLGADFGDGRIGGVRPSRFCGSRRLMAWVLSISGHRHADHHQRRCHINNFGSAARPSATSSLPRRLDEATHRPLGIGPQAPWLPASTSPVARRFQLQGRSRAVRKAASVDRFDMTRLAAIGFLDVLVTVRIPPNEARRHEGAERRGRSFRRRWPAKQPQSVPVPRSPTTMPTAARRIPECSAHPHPVDDGTTARSSGHCGERQHLPDPRRGNAAPSPSPTWPTVSSARKRQPRAYLVLCLGNRAANRFSR